MGQGSPRRRLVVSALLAATALSAPAAAQNTQWVGATGTWFSSGNWLVGVPTAGTLIATVGNGGTAQIGAGAANAGSSLVINGGSTVSIDPGGSLAAGAITIGPGTLLTGSSAITGPINLLAGARLGATATATIAGATTFQAGTSRLSAATGTTLTFNNLFFARETSLIVGVPGDTGTVIFAETFGASREPVSEVTVVAGTLAVTTVLASDFLRGNVFVVGGAQVAFSGTASPGFQSLQGAGAIDAGTKTLQIRSGNFGGTIHAGELVVFAAGPNQNLLTLSGNNTYTGGTRLVAIPGYNTILRVNADAALGDPSGVIRFHGGTLQFAQDFSSARPVTLRAFDGVNPMGGIIDTDGHTATLSGTISDGGMLTKIGEGTLILSGTNSYGGGTSIQQGTLQVDNGNALGIGPVVLRGGTLRAGASLTLANDVVLPTNTVGVISAAAGRTLTLSSRLSWSTNTTLVFGNGSDTGTVEFAGRIPGTANAPAIVVAAGTLRPIFAGAVDFDFLATAAPSVLIGSGATLEYGALGGALGNLFGAGTITSDGSVVVRAGNFEGTMSGLGTLAKAGPGVLRIAGSNFLLGATTVFEGTLQVDGQVVAPVTVNEGAVLGGNGSTGAATVFGTLSPGASIGTLTVNNTLNLAANATTLIEVVPGSSDRINVAGAPATAGLTGTLRVVPLTGAGFIVGSRTTILSAPGGVAGVFASTVNANPYFTFAPVYGATQVELELQSFNPNALANAVPVANARAVGSAIDQIVVGGNPDNVIVQAIIAQPATSYAAALTSMSGEISTATIEPSFRLGRSFVDSFFDQIGRARGATTAAGAVQRVQLASAAPLPGFAVDRPSEPSRWSAWAAGFGGGGTIAGDPATGSARVSYSGGGGAFGFDYRPAPDLLLGLGVGAAGTGFSLSGRDSSGDSRAFFFGAYASASRGPLYVDAGAFYGHNDFQTARVVPLGDPERATGAFSGRQWGGRFELGYRFRLGDVEAAPFAGMTALGLHSDPYTEDARVISTGSPGTFGLSYAAANSASVRSALGGQLAAHVAIDPRVAASVRARAAWLHEFDTTRRATAGFAAVPGAAFSIDGARPARDAAQLSLAVDVAVGRRVVLYAGIDSELSGTGNVYAGSGGLRVAW